MSKKIISNKIKKILFENKNVISVSIVGSLNDNKKLKNIGDIDVVLILNKLNKQDFNRCNNSILGQKKFFEEKFKKKLLINNTFGPVKFDYSKFIVIHLMIYDISSHIHHVKNSPFTCFDWERSNNFIGKSLKEIYSVNSLTLYDFFESRRSPSDYLSDLSKNKISYRKYNFKKRTYSLIKKYHKISENQKIEFYKHIIKNLITNLYKLENNINSPPTLINEKKLFLKVTINNNKLYQDYIKIKNHRINKFSLNNNSNIVKEFIFFFNSYIGKIKQKKNIIFKRHNKTKLNDGSFFGQGRDASIISKKINKNLSNKNFFICFSSPSKRAIETANLYINKKRLEINNNLKEIDYGLAEGLSLKELNIHFPNIAKKWSKFKDAKFPAGENNQDVLKRVNLFLNFLLNYSKGINGNILVITHNVFLRCLFGYYFNIPRYKWHKLEVDYNDYYQFIIQNKKIIINISRKKLNKIIKNL